MTALRRDKTDLDRYLRETAVIVAGCGPDVELTLDAWYYRWLYDRAHALWVRGPRAAGGETLFLAAIPYLPPASALDHEPTYVPCRVVRDLLDAP